MYNTLLNDFEEDGNSSTEAGFRKVTTEEEATETPASENAKAEAVVNPPAVARKRAKKVAVAADTNESWSDDPVRMYLTQMGEIPLLTRA